MMKDSRIIKFGYLFYTIVLLIHILIIAKAIPYNWINGGRSESYNAQLQISIVNTLITFIGFWYVFANQKFQKLQNNKIFRFIKWALIPFWGFSLILQFLGTSFEMFVMSPIILFGIFAHVSLARLRWVMKIHLHKNKWRLSWFWNMRWSFHSRRLRKYKTIIVVACKIQK